MPADAAKDSVGTESLIITNASLAPGQELDVFMIHCACAEVLAVVLHDLS